MNENKFILQNVKRNRNHFICLAIEGKICGIYSVIADKIKKDVNKIQ